MVYVGKERWMDLKNEIKPGDFVIYKKTGLLVCNSMGRPFKVNKVMNASEFNPQFDSTKIIVTYVNGHFDFLDSLEKASPLLLELI